MWWSSIYADASYLHSLLFFFIFGLLRLHLVIPDVCIVVHPLLLHYAVCSGGVKLPPQSRSFPPICGLVAGVCRDLDGRASGVPQSVRRSSEPSSPICLVVTLVVFPALIATPSQKCYLVGNVCGAKEQHGKKDDSGFWVVVSGCILVPVKTKHRHTCCHVVK